MSESSSTGAGVLGGGLAAPQLPATPEQASAPENSCPRNLGELIDRLVAVRIREHCLACASAIGAEEISAESCDQLRRAAACEREELAEEIGLRLRDV